MPRQPGQHEPDRVLPIITGLSRYAGRTRGAGIINGPATTVGGRKSSSTTTFAPAGLIRRGQLNIAPVARRRRYICDISAVVIRYQPIAVCIARPRMPSGTESRHALS